MTLADFIRTELEPILVEFERFARTMIPPASTMTPIALRDHSKEILLAIAEDMESAQTEPERDLKSRGQAVRSDTRQTAATAHGALRQLVGFDLNQLGAEFRALRATVLRQWQAFGDMDDPAHFEAMIRFNEAIDQALAESIAAYSDRMTQSRDMFLAVLGHDLRSPLGALSGCVQILDATATPAPTRQRTTVIARRSISAIDQMITDLLEYTKTRLGRGIEVTPAEGDFGALCQQASDEARAAHPERALVFTPTGNLVLPFDAARMRQVIANLLGNAIQHGDADHPVHFDVSGEEDEVRAVVSNLGPSIPPESLQVIFEPMVQVVHRATGADERPSTSLGLGLHIAREIVNAHGGRIGVTSSDAAGTAFTVCLPRRGAGQA